MTCSLSCLPATYNESVSTAAIDVINKVVSYTQVNILAGTPYNVSMLNIFLAVAVAAAVIVILSYLPNCFGRGKPEDETKK